jgi:hypothetical protein
MTAALIYPPERGGYSYSPGEGYIATKLKGGHTRIKKDVLEPSHIIQANWVLKETEYTEFMGFFHSTLQDASLPFLCELLGDLSILTTHKCRCIGGRPRLTANRGNAFYVAATLEVENNATYTGDIEFGPCFVASPTRIRTPGHVLSAYQVPDLFRVHRAIPDPAVPTFHFDGIYVVDAKSSSVGIDSTNGHLVRPVEWATVDGGGTIITIPNATITRVPT